MDSNTMKIFAALFFIFIPGINSQFSFNVQGYVGGFVSTTFCSTGQYLNNAASDVKSICSSTSGKSRLDLKVFNYICGSTAYTIGYVGSVFTPHCQSASQDPTLLPGLPTLLPTLPTLLPTLPTILPTIPTELADIVTELADIPTVLSDVATALPTLPTVLPTLPTVLPKLPTALPKLPTLLPTLPALIPTTKKPCNHEQMDRCIDICKRRASFTLNLGPDCHPVKYGGSYCDCKELTHCDVYKNETCFQKCKRYGDDTEVCKIPEAGYQCVCKFYSGNTAYYRAMD